MSINMKINNIPNPYFNYYQNLNSYSYYLPLNSTSQNHSINDTYISKQTNVNVHTKTRFSNYLHTSSKNSTSHNINGFKGAPQSILINFNNPNSNLKTSLNIYSNSITNNNSNNSISISFNNNNSSSNNNDNIYNNNTFISKTENNEKRSNNMPFTGSNNNHNKINNNIYMIQKVKLKRNNQKKLVIKSFKWIYYYI